MRKSLSILLAVLLTLGSLTLPVAVADEPAEKPARDDVVIVFDGSEDNVIIQHPTPEQVEFSESNDMYVQGQESLFVDMQEGIGFMEQFYLYNDWFCTLVKNCQQKGIIQNKNDHKALVNSAVYSAFGILFEWCRKRGEFDLAREAFTAHEAIYHVHPDYRGLWRKLHP